MLWLKVDLQIFPWQQKATLIILSSLYRCSYLNGVIVYRLCGKVHILPWQMKSTRIIKFSYHKKPWNAVFLGILPTCSCLVKSYILRGANLNGTRLNSCKELSRACFHLLCEDSILSTTCRNSKAMLDKTNILSCLYILLISRTTVEPHNSIFSLSHFRIKIESLQS